MSGGSRRDQPLARGLFDGRVGLRALRAGEVPDFSGFAAHQVRHQ